MRRTRQSQDRVRGLIVEIGGEYLYFPIDSDLRDAHQGLYVVTSLQHELSISSIFSVIPKRLTFFRLLFSFMNLVLDPFYTSLSFICISPLAVRES
jgi:hypothetical protein